MNERQAMEVDEVIPGMLPSSPQMEGGFIMCEVEEQQAARRSKFRAQQRRAVIRVESEETQDSVRETVDL